MEELATRQEEKDGGTPESKLTTLINHEIQRRACRIMNAGTGRILSGVHTVEYNLNPNIDERTPTSTKSSLE